MLLFLQLPLSWTEEKRCPEQGQLDVVIKSVINSSLVDIRSFILRCMYQWMFRLLISDLVYCDYIHSCHKVIPLIDYVKSQFWPEKNIGKSTEMVFDTLDAIRLRHVWDTITHLMSLLFMRHKTWVKTIHWLYLFTFLVFNQYYLTPRETQP